MISMANDLLNLKINVPTSKAVDCYVKSTSKHSIFAICEKIVFDQFYFKNHGTLSFLCLRPIFCTYEISVFCF